MQQAMQLAVGLSIWDYETKQYYAVNNPDLDTLTGEI